MDKKTVMQNPDIRDQSITELLGQLTSDLATLVGEQLALAKQEFREKMQALRNGTIIIAIGAGFGIVAFMTLWAAFIIWLTSYYLAPEIAAVVTGSGLILFAAIIVFIGIKFLRKATAEPIKTVEELQGRTGNG